MTQKTIVLLCENNHYDSLTHAAEEAVIDRLDKKKWTHSLVEGRDFVENRDFTRIESIDLYTNYFLRTSSENLCYRNNFALKQRFVNSFVSYDFDVDSNRDDFFNELNLCPKLDRLHSSVAASEFFGILTEKLFVDQPATIKRDEDIVKNLENLSIQLGNNYTIGWAGQNHCVDFHHHLTAHNPSLFEKVKFININSQCSHRNIQPLEILAAALQIYIFSECLNDTRVQEIYQRAVPFITLINNITAPQGKIHYLWEEDFLESPDVLNLNLSIVDEPDSILPWQVAGLDIFN